MRKSLDGFRKAVNIMNKKRYLITGATGHLGAGLLRELRKHDIIIRIIIRSHTCPDYLQDYVDELYYYEDVSTDFKALKEAMKDVDVVIHAAALISILSGRKKKVYQTNVEGVKNVIKACQEAGVKRLVHVASVHALGYKNKKQIIDETCSTNPKYLHGNYAKTKATATNLVLDASSDTFETVVVMPSGIIGPYDYRAGSPFGAFLKFYARGKMPAYLKGEYNFVDVRDVSAAIYEASVRGKRATAYLLSGEVITVKEILDSLQVTSSIPTPKLCVPIFLARLVAPFVELHGRMFHKEPFFTPYSLNTLTSNPNCNNARARQDLGFEVRDVKESLRDQYLFMTELDPTLVPKKKKNKKL